MRTDEWTCQQLRWFKAEDGSLKLQQFMVRFGYSSKWQDVPTVSEAPPAEDTKPELPEAFKAIAEQLANKIAADIFMVGEEPGYPTTRIAFKSDQYTPEREMGGLSLLPLINVIRRSIEGFADGG